MRQVPRNAFWLFSILVNPTHTFTNNEPLHVVPDCRLVNTIIGWRLKLQLIATKSRMRRSCSRIEFWDQVVGLLKRKDFIVGPFYHGIIHALQGQYFAIFPALLVFLGQTIHILHRSERRVLHVTIRDVDRWPFLTRAPVLVDLRLFARARHGHLLE